MTHAYQFKTMNETADLSPYLNTALYQGFDPIWLVSQQTDLHCIIVDAQNIPQARCSLWWRQVPLLPNETLGVIGHYAALQQAASDMLLQHACAQLQRQACGVAVGPMNGNTWRSYRFVCETSGEAEFFLEPTNPTVWPEYWRQAG